jgi:hypothetical protein
MGDYDVDATLNSTRLMVGVLLISSAGQMKNSREDAFQRLQSSSAYGFKSSRSGGALLCGDHQQKDAKVKNFVRDGEYIMLCLDTNLGTLCLQNQSRKEVLLRIEGLPRAPNRSNELFYVLECQLFDGGDKVSIVSNNGNEY